MFDVLKITSKDCYMEASSELTGEVYSIVFYKKKMYFISGATIFEMEEPFYPNSNLILIRKVKKPCKKMKKFCFGSTGGDSNGLR